MWYNAALSLLFFICVCVCVGGGGGGGQDPGGSGDACSTLSGSATDEIMLQKSESRQVIRFAMLISPIECGVTINHKPDGLFNGNIQSYFLG